MNVFQIAYRSIRQRGLASLLTLFSMALGVMLVVAVLSIHGVVSQQFRNNASLGYNLLVGATKGGRLQLTLNSVFYLSQPVENIDYRYYLEFVGDEERRRGWTHSLAAEGARLTAAAIASAPLGGMAGGVVAETLQAADLERLGIARGGRFTDLIDYAIPLCLGDYYGRFRVVATTGDFFDRLTVGQPTVGPDGEEQPGRFQFADGKVFEPWSEQHGFFEAVVGSTVAKEMQIQVGDKISPAHGDPEGEAHDRYFIVSGVLEPSGTPNDRAVFVNMEGFFLMEGHSKPLQAPDVMLAAPAEPDPLFEEGERVEMPKDGSDGAHFKIREPLELEKREVTAVLVKTMNPFVGANLMTMINKGNEAQCAQPVKQIYSLLEVFVRPIQWVLLFLAGMICLVSGVSILVSIYNSMSDRRHEIAVIRALGAGRGTVFEIVLLEAIMLSVGGGLLGWAAGHGMNVAVSGAVEARTGVRMGFFDFAPPIDFSEMLGSDTQLPFLNISPELLIIPALLVLAVLVGLLPAVSAYNTNVARWLGK